MKKRAIPPGLPVHPLSESPNMPVYTRTDRDGDLRVVLFNGDDILDDQLAATPQEANRVAIMMLSSRVALNQGDTLTVRNADEESPPLAPIGGIR
jgi:hypothetical protein